MCHLDLAARLVDVVEQLDRRARDYDAPSLDGRWCDLIFRPTDAGEEEAPRLKVIPTQFAASASAGRPPQARTGRDESPGPRFRRPLPAQAPVSGLATDVPPQIVAYKCEVARRQLGQYRL